jgi:hypothetical protein
VPVAAGIRIKPSNRDVADAHRWTGNWGGWPVSIEADAETSHLLQALPPSLETVPAQADGFEIRFSSGDPDPRDLAAANWQVREYWGRCEQLRVRNADGSQLIFDPFSCSASALRGQSGSVWYDTGRSLPAWVMAAPALQLIDWWATPRGLLATHAAGVCFGGQAALLIGAGGSGKSTFAVEAARLGMGFLGDDYVLVQAVEQPVAYTLFRSAKLLAQTEVPNFSLLVPAQTTFEKNVSVANDDLLVPSSPIGAVIAPVIGDLAEPCLTPMRAAEALRRAIPSVLRQMPGMEAAKTALLSKILRAVPCYRLDLCRDHGRNIAAVARLFEDLGVAL